MTGEEREKRARKVARLYASGLSVRQAAAKVGIHHQTALDDLSWLDRSYFGTKRRTLDRKHQSARGKRRDEAIRLRTQGLSLRQIAGELGVSYQTVANDLARWKAEHPNVIGLSRSGAANPPPGGQDVAPEFDTVVPLSRKLSTYGVTSYPPGGQDLTP